MGRIRNLAESFHEFATNYVEKEDGPGVADGDDGYDRSTKLSLLLLKEEINKPLRKLEDYLNEMPGILGVFDLEKSPDYTSFSIWDGEFPMQELRGFLELRRLTPVASSGIRPAHTTETVSATRSTP